MLIQVAVVVGLVVVMLSCVAATAAWIASKSVPPVVTAPSEDPLGPIVEALAVRVAQLETLPSLYEEAVDRAKKHSLRAQDSERRADEKLQQLEFAQELHGADGAGGEGRGLFAMPGNVAPTADSDLKARAAALQAQGLI